MEASDSKEAAAPSATGGGAERRRHRRYEVEDVLGHLRLTFNAKILNLSVEGMALETNGWLSVGRRYGFKIRHEDELIDLSGTVSWCSLVRTERKGEETLPVYRAGIQFEDSLTEKAVLVRDFLHHNALMELDSTRAFGRFRLKDQGEVDVDLRRDFVVRRLSLSGLLLEADLEPQLETRFDLELRIDDRVIEMAARVAYVQRLAGESHGRSEIGMEFLELPPEIVEVLEALLSPESEEAEAP